MSVGQPKRILIVEDDERVANILKRLVESIGHEVHVEGSGREALSDAAEHQPDLVILDLRLPDMSGYEVCKGIRKLYTRWSLPILMLTGMDAPSDQLRGFAHGADAYLTKPYDQTELLQTITLLLGETALT